jgi:threonine/homoserine/homoserine lactone efflux protein
LTVPASLAILNRAATTQVRSLHENGYSVLTHFCTKLLKGGCMIGYLASGLSFGISAALMPGPLQTYLIQITLTRGWRVSLPLILVPILSDAPIILLTMLVLSQVPPEFVRVIQIVGGVFVLWLAYSTWKTIRNNPNAFSTTGENSTFNVNDSSGRILLKMMGINLLSPGPYIFWSTVNGPMLTQALRESVLAGAALLIAFYGAFMAVLALYVVVFERLRHLDPKIVRGLLMFTVLLLVIMGVRLIGEGLGVW